MLLSGSTKSSSAASRHRPCCPQRRPPRCCFGRCSPPVRSPCARSMVGGPFLRSSSLNALTSQLDPISSVFRRHRQPSFHTIRDGTVRGGRGGEIARALSSAVALGGSYGASSFVKTQTKEARREECRSRRRSER